MSEIRKKLSEYQLAALGEYEREVLTLKDLLEKAQQKQQVAVNLILEAHGLLGQQVQFDPQTKEFVATITDIVNPAV